MAATTLSPSPSQQEQNDTEKKPITPPKYRPTNTFLIVVAVLGALFIFKVAFNLYCRRTAKDDMRSDFANDALHEFKGALEVDLDMHGAKQCVKTLQNIERKISGALTNLDMNRQKLQELQDVVGGASDSNCDEKRQTLWDMLRDGRGPLTSFLNNQFVRWMMFTVATLGAYGFLIYQARVMGTKADASEEARTAGMWLDFTGSLGGYAVERGNPNTPSLYDFSDKAEIMMNVALLVCTIAFVFITWKVTPRTYTYFLINFSIYIHVLLLLYMIPVNAFHERYLYNMRCYAATVVERPSYELLLAFIFIVLLPLPGVNPNTSVGARFGWLALKLGVFYVIQSVLLGSPHYKIEPYDENKATALSRTDFIYYGIIAVLALLLILFNTWGHWGCNASSY